MVSLFNMGNRDFVQPFEVMIKKYEEVFEEEQEKLT